MDSLIQTAQGVSVPLSWAPAAFTVGFKQGMLRFSSSFLAPHMVFPPNLPNVFPSSSPIWPLLMESFSWMGIFPGTMYRISCLWKKPVLLLCVKSNPRLSQAIPGYLRLFQALTAHSLLPSLLDKCHLSHSSGLRVSALFPGLLIYVQMAKFELLRFIWERPSHRIPCDF